VVIWGFLMHRVELKVFLFVLSSLYILSVPNAPCGVERVEIEGRYTFSEGCS